MSEFDWLDEPVVLKDLTAEGQDEQFVAEVEALAKSGALYDIVERDTPGTAIAPKDSDSRKARLEFAVAFRALKPRQREFLQALRQYDWQISKACKALKKTGTPIDRSSHSRWLHQDDVYAFVFNALKARARAAAVDKDSLILNADKIYKNALKARPILFKGKPTGYYENKPDTALRAVELLMKTQKMLGNDQQDNTQGNGPPLIIQIVQADTNKVVDVTHGVTIDMPVPSAD